MIVDEAIGNAEGTVNLHYQLAEGEVKIDKNSSRVITDYPGESNVLLQCFGPKGTEMIEEEGWYSLLYRERAKRPAIAFNIDKKKRYACTLCHCHLSAKEGGYFHENFRTH